MIEIKSDDSGIHIVVNNNYAYGIGWQQMNTPGQILGWLNHLSFKSWMDTQSLAVFANAAFEHINILKDYDI